MPINTLAEAMERREADMRYIAITISREIHRRGWTNHIDSFDNINSRLDHPMPELQQDVSVSANLKVQFAFSTTVMGSGNYNDGPDTEESTLIEAANDEGSWDESFHSNPTSSISRLIEIGDLEITPLD